METDWMWCYECPKEAAKMIDDLSELLIKAKSYVGKSDDLYSEIVNSVGGDDE
jgi:uncharacterized protein (DUF427 family)